MQWNSVLLDPLFKATLDDFDFLQLPIGVYLVAPDGRFFALNSSVRKILRLPLKGNIQANIRNFYAHPEHREELLKIGSIPKRWGSLRLKVGRSFKKHLRNLALRYFSKKWQNYPTRSF